MNGSDEINSKLRFFNQSNELLHGPEINSNSKELFSEPEYLVLEYWRDLIKKLDEFKTQNNGIRVAVEGNIACGKSTFLQYIKNQNWIDIKGEPLDEWTNLKGHNILKLLYSDLHRWSYTFQTFAQLTLVKRAFSESNKLQIVERSLESNRFCFAELAYKNQFLNKDEYETIVHWFQVFEPFAKNDFIIYFRCSPQKCYERVRKRNRPEESNLTLQYFEDLHLFHEKWLMNDKSNVFVVDCENDELKCEYKEIIEFLRKIDTN